MLLRKPIVVFIFVSVLLIIQCTSNENSKSIELSANYFEININPKDAKEVEIQDLIKNYSYLKLKIPDSLYFSRIVKILFDDDIYMLDKSNFQDQILSFDLDGNFKFHINKPGRGPGEFESIYDFDVEGNAVLLSTPSGLKFYDKYTGAYLKTFPSSKEIRIQNFKMLDSNLLVTEGGRYKSNTSKKQIKVLDLDKREVIWEAVSSQDQALKGSHSNRYLYNYGDSLSVLPMYDQTVYRVFEDSSGVSIKAAFKVNFGEYWVTEELLAVSYQDRSAFFNRIGNYISTFDVFETDQNIYIHYKYSEESYALIYDKVHQISKNVRNFSNNELGWFRAPVATYKNSIVNTITIQKVADYLPKGNKGDFQQFFSPPNEQNTLVLLFIELE